MLIKFSQNQLNNISRYLSDLSKIVVGSIVINYFVLSPNNAVSFDTFLSGSVAALALIWFSVIIGK